MLNRAELNRRLEIMIDNAKPLLYQMPNLIIFFKNLDFQFVDCNQQLVNFSKLSDKNRILGREDNELPWQEDFDFYRKIDKDLVSEKYQNKHIFLNVKVASGERKFGFQQKIIVKDEYGTALGIMIKMQELHNKLSDTLVSIKCRDLEIISKQKDFPLHYIRDVYKDYALTDRESECLFYLLRGMDTKMIAKHLSRSPRTIEKFFEKLNVKLGCYSRAQLMEKVYSDGFMNIIPPTINFEFLGDYLKDDL